MEDWHKLYNRSQERWWHSRLLVGVGELTVVWRSRSCNSVAEDTTHHADSFARALAYADCISAASAVASPLAQTPGILLRISTCVV